MIEKLKKGKFWLAAILCTIIGLAGVAVENVKFNDNSFQATIMGVDVNVTDNPSEQNLSR